MFARGAGEDLESALAYSTLGALFSKEAKRNVTVVLDCCHAAAAVAKSRGRRRGRAGPEREGHERGARAARAVLKRVLLHGVHVLSKRSTRAPPSRLARCEATDRPSRAVRARDPQTSIARVVPGPPALTIRCEFSRRQLVRAARALGLSTAQRRLSSGVYNRGVEELGRRARG
jgi:hypothetical protein